MSKYEPLERFLIQLAPEKSEIQLTFDEIEDVLGDRLPASARYRAWWSNNPTNSVMTRSWLRAGFVSEKVDVNARTLTFRHDPDKAARHLGEATPNRYDGASAQEEPPPVYGVHGRHPLIGALKGAIRIAPGADLTQPADPEWGNQR